MVTKVNLPKLQPKEEAAVTSSVVDVFYTPRRQPVSSVVGDIARSLGGLVPSLQKYQDVKEERVRTDEEEKADKDFLMQNKKEFKDLVKDGTIKEGANPYYVKRYVKNSLRETARTFERELYDAYAKNKIVEDPNPSAFVEFYKKFSSDFRDNNNLGAYDSASLAEGFIPYAEATRSGLANRHILQRVSVLENKQIESIGDFIEGELLRTTELEEADLDRALQNFNIESANLSYEQKETLYLSQLIQNKIDLDIEEGLSATKANNKVVEKVIEIAKLQEDEDILLILDNIITDKQSGGRLAGSYRSEIADALKDIADIQLISEKNRIFVEEQIEKERREDVLNYFANNPTLLQNPFKAMREFDISIAFQNEQNKDKIDAGEFRAAPPLSATEKTSIFQLANIFNEGRNKTFIEKTEDQQEFIKELNFLLVTDPGNPRVLDMLYTGWDKYFTTAEGKSYLDKYNSRSKLDGSQYTTDFRYSQPFDIIDSLYDAEQAKIAITQKELDLQVTAKNQLIEIFYEALEDFQDPEWLKANKLVTLGDRKKYLFKIMTDEAIRIRDILAANNTVLNQNAIGNVTIDNQKRLIEGLEVVNPYEDENL